MQPLRARLVASRPAASAYAESLAQLPPDLRGAEGRVGRLTIYPVKAFGGVDVPALRVERRGLVEPASGLADRACMIAVRRPGVAAGAPYDALALTNRIDGTATLARGRLEGASVVYEAPRVEPVRLSAADLAPRDGPTLRVRMYEGGPILDAVPAEGALTDFARALLRAHPRARRFEPDDVVAAFPPRAFRREIPERHRAGQAAETLYGDGAHLLVASSSTLAWMNDDLRSGGERAVDMAAFRPNVVVDGLPPNAEDVVAEAEALGRDGAVPVLFASFCVRCDATRLDPATGEKPDRQPLAWLARQRPPREDDPNSATFAVNAIVPEGAHGRVIRAGDLVRVRRERA